MLWLKAFHIMFVIAWFAGLLYLPRLFVYHADTHDQAGRARFETMERKLFAITTVGGSGALLFGAWLLVGYTWPAHGAATWLVAKLALVAGLVVYHVYCGKLVADFRANANRHGHRFYRMINEIPALAMVVIVLLVVLKQPL